MNKEFTEQEYLEMEDRQLKRNAQAYPKQFNSSGGLTKRELFAAMIMQALFSNSKTDGSYNEYASDAVRGADFLIEELDKK